jgi:hypothetical protein
VPDAVTSRVDAEASASSLDEIVDRAAAWERIGCVVP